jgi:hypothetical protein
VRILFTVTLFLSSLLLFLIEPMIAKMILPRFGGSPGVWNTSMLFFQVALLAGYGYAHLATKWLGPRVQAITHLAILLLPAFVLPFGLPNGIRSGVGNPAPLVLLMLTISVGLPFLVVSAGAPLLQRWFAATKDPHAKDPYFLYSASNLGSMLALLAYPFLIEPRFRLTDQSVLWTFGYCAMVALMAICAAALFFARGKPLVLHESPTTIPPAADEELPANPRELSLKRRLLWIGLAFCPSSLLLGITTYLTSNIAPVPLLWVLPLALYLLTFIVAFARKRVISGKTLGRFLPLLIVPLAFTMILEASEPGVIIPLVVLHLLVFFLASLMCHQALADDRPRPEHLTEFYFYVSLGGVLGGVFNALIAPTIFNSFFEYPLILGVACYFRPMAAKQRFTRADWIYPAALGLAMVAITFVARIQMPEPTPLRSGITIGIPLLLVFLTADTAVRFASSLIVLFAMTSLMQVAVAGRIIDARRSFFGVHRVEAHSNKYGLFHSLLHGNTIHGQENLDEKVRDKLPESIARDLIHTPLTYYYPTGPIGQVFRVIGPSRRKVALIGLGIGSLAAYGKPYQDFTYYEIDPDVVTIASDPNLFHFVDECRANLKIELGDARLELAKARSGGYDLIVLDAFSSDSIPLHLLTREAVELYLSKLSSGGVLAFHISNRYLDLQPVLAKAASSLGLLAWVQEDEDMDLLAAKSQSTWVVMAKSESDLVGLRKRDPSWEPLHGDPSFPVWTDDYSNIASVLRLFNKQEP